MVFLVQLKVLFHRHKLAFSSVKVLFSGAYCGKMFLFFFFTEKNTILIITPVASKLSSKEFSQWHWYIVAYMALCQTLHVYKLLKLFE